MSTKLIRSIPILGLAFCLTTGLRPALTQEHPKNVENKGQRSRGAGGKDENIKQDKQANDPNAKAQAPPDKGGPKTRQGVCAVHVDNRTQWSIDVYFDGSYRGTVGPWGDSIGAVGCGNTTLYARALFVGGEVLDWGPRVHYVDGTTTWTLR